MNALDLLKDLTAAIQAVRAAADAAAEAFKISYAAPVAGKVAAKARLMEADTRHAHAKHEAAAALAAAQTYINAQ